MGEVKGDRFIWVEIKQWAEGGAYRAALQAVVGGLGGDVSGTLGAGATSLAAPLLSELQASITQQLKDAGVPDKVAELAGQSVALTTASSIGAAASGGNVTGIAGGLNVDANNRLLHVDEISLIKSHARDFAKRLNGGKEPSQQQIDTAETRLLDQANRNVNQHSDLRLDGAANLFLTDLKRELVKAGQDRLPNSGEYFIASPSEYFNDGQYIETLNTAPGQQAYQQIRAGNFGNYLPGYYFKQGIEDANKEARRQAIAATAFGTVILLPEVASVCLANPVACNQAGITASEVLSEGGVVAGGTLGTKKAIDEINAAKQAAKQSLKNASGDLESAENSARIQPHSNGASASPSPGANAAGNSGRDIQFPTNIATTALDELKLLPSLTGRSQNEISVMLQARGFKPVIANNGGVVWTKALPDGYTAAVRLDPPTLREVPKGFADEVPHAHKEIVPTAKIENGNYKPKYATTLDDSCCPTTNPAKAHIPIK